MHLGNAMTALLAWLQMRSVNGELVLRIEDIDKQRSKLDYADQIMYDMRWLGLNWDEGPEIGGSYGPYMQSSRQSYYKEALQILHENDWLYPCYCSRAELQSIANAPHGLAAEGSAYPGTCRGLSTEAQALRAAHKQPSYRFKVANKVMALQDGVHGVVTCNPEIHGDFIIQRADGIYSYQLAVVVDDAQMNITDVLRGDDLLDSTFRQLELYDALHYKAPTFAHVPLLIDMDNNRLSKRNRSLSIAAVRQAGTRPEKLLGWLAYWSGIIDRPESVQLNELLDHFSMARLGRHSAIIEQEAMKQLIGQHT